MFRKLNWLNPKSVLTAIILIVAIAGLAIFNNYQKEKHIVRASDHYMHMLKLLHSKNYTEAENICLSIVKNYSKTSYAKLSSLILAKLSFYDKDFDLTRIRLSWAIENSSKNELLLPIMYARMAKLEFYAGQYDVAMKVIEKAKLLNLNTPILDEIKGDILISKGEKLEAIKIYKGVVADLKNNKHDFQMVLNKLNDLGVDNVPEVDDTHNS